MATKHIKTTTCELNSYNLQQVDYEDCYRDVDRIKKPPTL